MTPAEFQPIAGLAAGGLGLYCLRCSIGPFGAMCIFGMAGDWDHLPQDIQALARRRFRQPLAESDKARLFKEISQKAVLTGNFHLLAGAALCFVAGLLLRGSL